LRSSPETLIARVLARTRPDGDCLTWTGRTMANGYGQIQWSGGWLVHRAMWTAKRGEIPSAMTIDHLCRNRTCVLVDHMEVVTRGENSRRGGGTLASVAARRARTHCKRGHEYNDQNTKVGNDGRRICLPCQRMHWSNWYTRAGRRNPRTLAPCPSVGAYRRHLKAGEDCARCRQANAEHRRSRSAAAPGGSLPERAT